jgi:hypothetical protein
MPPPLQLDLVCGARQPPPAHQPLHLGRGALAGIGQELGFPGGVGHACGSGLRVAHVRPVLGARTSPRQIIHHPRQRPDLGERQLASTHGLRGQRHAPQGTGRPHPLPGRAPREPGGEVEPLGAVAVPAQLPAAPAVELGDELQEPVLGGVDVGRQRGDLFLQLQDRVLVVEGVREGVRRRFSWNVSAASFAPARRPLAHHHPPSDRNAARHHRVPTHDSPYPKV